MFANDQLASSPEKLTLNEMAEDALLPVASQRALSPAYNRSTFVDKRKHLTAV
jgi:hypothetical protein